MGAGPVYAEPEREQQPSQDVIEPEAAPAAPVPLVVGAADDRAEVDADRRADDALARLAPHREHDHAHGVRRSASAPSGAIGLAGGALDGDTEQRLTSRLGRGGALDAGVRRRMEGAFGSSFSHVNVHTDGEADALSRQMSATAFTVGNDLFFSQGAYRPGDESGERLIAHELAHVEQQGAGAHRMTVHRAVGFEFETNVIAKKRLTDGSFEKYPKATVLKQYDGFRMETDENSQVGSTIEFVVDPPVQETDRKKLVKIMDKMTSLAQTIKDADDKTLDKATTPIDQWQPTKSLRDAGIGGTPRDAWVLPDYLIQSNPQVTGGIDFDKIIDLMSEMGTKGDKRALGTEDAKAATSLEGVSAKAADFAGKVKAGGGPEGLPNPSKELQGMAALLVSYLVFGSSDSGGLLNYAKLISNSIMLRTDFGSLFMKLPEKDYDVLIHNPRGFMTWILQIAELDTEPDEAVFQRGVQKSNDPNDPGYGVKDDDAGLAISRRDWLLGISMGVDHLSAKTNRALSAKLEGLGALGGAFDAVGDEAGKKPKNQTRTGAVMEFRNMPKDVFYKDWGPLALRTFDYIAGLNNR